VKKGIHPRYEMANITCSTCHTVWPVRSTRATIRLDICSKCHPFYTGEQRIVDTAGQVDRFMKRLAVTQQRQAVSQKGKAEAPKPQKQSLYKEIYGDDAE
jgi:large subunit ribosomal protein L31